MSRSLNEQTIDSPGRTAVPRHLGLGSPAPSARARHYIMCRVVPFAALASIVALHRRPTSQSVSFFGPLPPSRNCCDNGKVVTMEAEERERDVSPTWVRNSSQMRSLRVSFID